MVNASKLLKLPSHLATDAFLKQHGAYLHYTEIDLEQDIEALDKALKSREIRASPTWLQSFLEKYRNLEEPFQG